MRNNMFSAFSNFRLFVKVVHIKSSILKILSYSQSKKLQRYRTFQRSTLKHADIWPKDAHLHASSFSNVRLRCNFMGLTIPPCYNSTTEEHG